MVMADDVAFDTVAAFVSLRVASAFVVAVTTGNGGETSFSVVGDFESRSALDADLIFDVNGDAVGDAGNTFSAVFV